MKVIIRKYIQSTIETYGYFAGATFANQIGLTTQMLLKNYAKQQNYSKELLSSVLSGITGPTAKKLIEWGIIYKFTS